MNSTRSIKTRILDEIKRRNQADYLAAYYPEIGLIDLANFNYFQLLSKRNLEKFDSDNYLSFVHEITHFHQNIGTIYGIDNVIIGVSNYHAITMILEIYKNHWTPKNALGKHLPIADFARAELLYIYDNGVMVPGDLIKLEVPPYMYEVLEYIAITDSIVSDFEGMSPIAMAQISPTWQWEHMDGGDYLSFVVPGPTKNLHRTHLIYVPASFRGCTEKTAISIGARSIQESWSAAIEAISCSEQETFPQLLRDQANECRCPEFFDYCSAFDYVEDHMKSIPRNHLLPVFLVCADIALMYSGILEHGFSNIDQLPWMIKQHEIKRLLEPGRIINSKPLAEYVPTTSEVFINAVKAAKTVRPLADNIAADLGRFMKDVIESMGLPQMQKRIRWYLDCVLLPFLKKRRSSQEDFLKAHLYPYYEPDATDYRLSVCEQALRTRIMYPDFFINVWNDDYRQRIAEQFRPLNIIDSSGEKGFIAHRNPFLSHWFINQLMNSKKARCPKVLFRLTSRGKSRCALEEQVSFQSASSDHCDKSDLSQTSDSSVQWPLCDNGTYEGLDVKTMLIRATCDIKGMYDYYQLKNWEQKGV